MRHLQENTRFLERYMGKVHEQLKMRIKFCKQKVSQNDLILMLLEYVDHESTLLTSADKNKENFNVANMQTPTKIVQNPQIKQICNCQIIQDGAKDQQILSLKEQMRIEEELTRNFFKMLKKEAFTDSINPLSRLSVRQSQRSASIVSPEPTLSVARQSFVTSGFEPSGERDNVLTTPNAMLDSNEVRTSNSGRVSRITSSFEEGRERTTEQERQKSKTFAKLRKVEALFCRGPSKPLSRNKSLASESWCVPNQDNSAMTQENLNLKAIQSSLVTHLSIMQKYKNAPSIQELVRKEQKLKRKEIQLRDLEHQLHKKERSLNLAQMQALKRQKSTKVLP